MFLALVHTEVAELMNNTGLASLQNLGALVALQWTDRGEEQLPALRMCRNVTDVDLAGNRLRELPELQTLKFLKKLSLARNQIKELWDLPRQLEHLNLSGNELRQVQLSLPLLKTLDLSHNQLSALSHLNTPSLTSLYASHNSIARIPALSRLSHIVEVDLEANVLDVDSVNVLFTMSTLAVANLRANPELTDLTPPEEWIQDANLLFYRQPGRLKELKSSRFKRTIKHTQASFEASYHRSLSPSKANSGDRQQTAGDILEDLIERCGVEHELRTLPKNSMQRYTKAADRIVACVNERESLRSALNTAEERTLCQASDFESMQFRQESGPERSFRLNLPVCGQYEDLNSAPARIHWSSDREHFQHFEVPRQLGSYIEKLKTQNAKLKEALSRVRSQRDRNAVLLRTKLET